MHLHTPPPPPLPPPISRKHSLLGSMFPQVSPWAEVALCPPRPPTPHSKVPDLGSRGYLEVPPPPRSFRSHITPSFDSYKSSHRPPPAASPLVASAADASPPPAAATEPASSARTSCTFANIGVRYTGGWEVAVKPGETG